VKYVRFCLKIALTPKKKQGLRLASRIRVRPVSILLAAAKNRAWIHPPKTLTALNNGYIPLSGLLMKKIADCTGFVTKNLMQCHISFVIFSPLM